MAINPDLPPRCEDWPCCGHVDGLPCNWVPGPEIYAHAGCDHEAGYCQEDDGQDPDDDLTDYGLIDEYELDARTHEMERELPA